MPNSIAFLALALWPLVMFVLFRRMPVGRALIWSFLGAYLLLPPHPTAFDFPLLPPLNKLTLPNLMAAFMVIFVAKQKIEIWPDSKVMRALIVVFVLSPIPTVFTNPEPVIFASGGLRGLYGRDIIALVFNQAVFLLGFILARQFLNTREHLHDILMALMVAGLFYSFPMLLEVRLSPQLNVWIYGYFPHVFEQVIRSGGFRAIVFLSHGIWAAMLIMMSLAAAMILWRTEEKGKRHWYFIAALYLAFVLVMNKTLGPVVYAFLLILLVLFTNWRLQARIAVVLAALVMIYPAAKTLNLVPEEQMLTLASKANDTRANSLRFRFDNENTLLDRAMEKPAFGWGTWGRNHVHNPITGTIMTVTDGRWILTMGVFGWFGFLAEFGILILPIFLFGYHAASSQRAEAKRWRSQISSDIPVKKQAEDRMARYVPSPIGGAISLLLALNMVDLLPNATLTPITWLLAGALLGYSERIANQSDDTEKLRNQPLSKTPNRIELPKGPRTVL